MELKSALTDSAHLTGAKRRFERQPIDIFGEMTEVELEVVSQMTTIKNYNRREPVYYQDDLANVIYFLKVGRVKIYKLSPEGKVFTLAILGPGEFFGEMALFDESPRGAIAETLDETQLGIIHRRDFERLLRKIPHLAMCITRLIGLRRREAENQLENFAFCSVPTRLARLLMSIAEGHGIRDSRGILLNVKFTQMDLANLIGAARETTSATLNEFRRLGVIDIQHRRIKVLDSAALKKMADATLQELSV